MYNTCNTCNASFQIGVPLRSSSHLFSVLRATNYAPVRGTLQVTHTSGTVGTPPVQWGSEHWAINKVQGLNVRRPECPGPQCLGT